MMRSLKILHGILITVIMTAPLLHVHAAVDETDFVPSDAVSSSTDGDTMFAPSTTLILDAENAATDTIDLQFGNNGLNEYLQWDILDSTFSISDDVNFNENKLNAAEIENVSALPGGAGGLGAAGEGRLVILDTSDNTAPGCTVNPYCSAGTYIWDGGAWVSLVGAPTSTNLTKVVTVGSTGADYTDIATAAAYLATRSGGIMLLSAETHSVTGAVDLKNVRLVGKDATRTKIQVSGAGQLDSFDTIFEYLTIETTGTLTDDMAIDVQSGSSSLIFNYVDFTITTGGDVLIDSNAGTAPTIIAKFIKSNMAGGSGAVLKAQSLANINAASDIFVDSRSSDTPLQLADWDITLAGGGSVYTTGTIISVPAQSIFVSPEMNLQGAIDSLESVGNGGLITLLPGTHNITDTLTIEGSGIQIVGYGDTSVIAASGISGGDTVGAIQVGSADGNSPVNDVVLKDFKLEVTGSGATDIHGIRVAGGSDNRIDNVTVEKVSGQSGTGGTARMGIQMVDGAAADLVRPVIFKSRVLGNSGAGAYFTDGIHITSDPSISGVFGNGNRISNALLDGNFVDYVRETAYVFVGADDSSLFNNRASGMGAGGGTAYGIYMGNATNINMNNNVFAGSLSASAIAIGVESFNAGSLKETIDSIFNNNVIEGTGSGFAVGFLIGNANNTGVHRNSFQNNSVGGPSAATTTAISIRGNADNNTFSNNNIAGGANGWDTGIIIAASTAEQNKLLNNRFVNTATWTSDSGTATQLGAATHQATTDPTVNDDIGDNYETGTVWINTATDAAYILTDNTSGAANWEQVSGGGGSTLAAVQARLSTSNAIPAIWTDVPFNQTDVESDATTLEHDNTNTDRILIKQDGIYRISYDFSVEEPASAGSAALAQARVRLNDSMVINGSEGQSASVNMNSPYFIDQEISQSFIASLTTNDFISLQMQYTGTVANAVANGILTIYKLDGVKGDAAPGTNNNTFTIDQDDTGGNVSLQFGTTLAETLSWDSVSGQFDLSDDLSVAGNVYANFTRYLPQVLSFDTTADSATGAGFQTLKSITIPANTLGTDNSVRITAWVRRTSGTGGGTFRIVYGTTPIAAMASANSNDPAQIEAVISGAGTTSSQRGYLDHTNSGNSGSATGTAAEDSTTALPLSLEVDLATDGDEWTSDYFLVEVIE